MSTYMDDYVDGYVYSDDGNYRVAVVGDETPERPDYDGGYPIFEARYGGAANVYYDGGYAPEFVQRAFDALDYFRTYRGMSTTIERFDRWLRIFHNGAVVERYDHRGGCRVAITGRPLREAWGVEHPDAEDTPDFGDFDAYWDGDVYLLVGQQRTIESTVTTTTFPDGEIAVTRTDEHEVWSDVEIVFGFYGLDKAKGAAVEDFFSLTGHDGPTRDYAAA